MEQKAKVAYGADSHRRCQQLKKLQLMSL